MDIIFAICIFKTFYYVFYIFALIFLNFKNTSNIKGSNAADNDNFILIIKVDDDEKVTDENETSAELETVNAQPMEDMNKKNQEIEQLRKESLFLQQKIEQMGEESRLLNYMNCCLQQQEAITLRYIYTDRLDTYIEDITQYRRTLDKLVDHRHIQVTHLLSG
ncbi:10521_t:CDS:2 [Racocetra fulgida]|uniref:10521_t:CDS:1 n=1 Tax=Racocetra fulgida TaxID=60492 RepID=A0A9N9BB10_9GLOM|nr:10521_t:CDS:2 [Racocetra fulgida]